jgi:acetyl-CoA carboxylase biotin carboxylase subunit
MKYQKVSTTYILWVKLIVWAPTREKAIERMKRALSDTIIKGIPTTIDYHKLILDIEDFRNGKVDTAFIPKHEEELKPPSSELGLTAVGALH